MTCDETGRHTQTITGAGGATVMYTRDAADEWEGSHPKQSQTSGDIGVEPNTTSVMLVP